METGPHHTDGGIHHIRRCRGAGAFYGQFLTFFFFFFFGNSPYCLITSRYRAWIILPRFLVQKVNDLYHSLHRMEIKTDWSDARKCILQIFVHVSDWGSDSISMWFNL